MTDSTTASGRAGRGEPLAGRYELGEELGRGGMSFVYRATDRLLERDVAVKVLHGGAGAEASDRARFAAEARTLAQLSHSGLVMILDAGLTTEDAYLILELVEGPTMARLLEAGPLPIERAGSIGVQLAEVLAYAHREGVVHRDIKPANVLLASDDRVKLADFGIARLIGDTVRHTRTGQTIGTAAYLAPEQVLGEPVTGAADIYALGLVLLEAITGVRAYPGPPTEAAVARLSRQPDVPSDLPGHWHHALSSMTARDPGHRPTAEQVAAVLRDEPTGHIPAATVRDVPVTRPLTAPATARPAPVAAHVDPAPDRAGDAIADGARRWARYALRKLRSTPSHLVGVYAAVAALVVLVVIVALAAGSGGGSDDLPPNTPPDLEQPLSNLHDAIEGD